ncbi:MAG: hypothetical protein HKN49_00550 [Gammaproteobacteria bacterium]|nr:hypothetical protein [Gammaproteobacteria bacterium]
MTSDARGTLYNGFKYSVYVLLTLNIGFYFVEDWRASTAIFSDGVGWGNFIEAYSATIDTLAWVILLLLFELETAVIANEKLQGRLAWSMAAMRTVCYAFIAWSLWGYIAKYELVTDLIPVTFDDVCALIGSGYTYIASFDDYFAIDAAACASLQGQPLFRIAGTQVIGTREAALLVERLALTDVINASTWLIVVVTLEIEVGLQLAGRLSPGLLRVANALKSLLYAILLACAIYWGLDGEFLDFWDAFLWLVAFAFIELNLFNWNAATTAPG